MNVEFKKRHDYFIAALNRLPGIVALPASGAFYAWADCSAAMMAFGFRDDNAFAEMLINDAGVAVVPGSGFGAPNHFRASFACSMATLEKSIERMKKVQRPVKSLPDLTPFPNCPRGHCRVGAVRYARAHHRAAPVVVAAGRPLVFKLVDVLRRGCGCALGHAGPRVGRDLIA
jgi:hypothetical protein